MNTYVKNRIVTMSFFIMIIGFMVMNMLIPDEMYSVSERRKLKGVPEYSLEHMLDGKVFEDFEAYTLDQFVFRDFFRGVKAFGTYQLFHRKDNNDIYIVNGNINKLLYPLNENAIMNAANKLNEVYNRYLTGKNVSFAIIPDKNYFVAEVNGYLSLDYGKLIEIMKQNVENMHYIDLFDSLTIKDFYNTDLHWKQERLVGIADKLLTEMGNRLVASNTEYTKIEYEPFFGSYYGQAALNLKPDRLICLTNDILENAIVYDYETNTEGKVYIPEKFGSMDSYDIYLNGAKPLLTIENPNSGSERELIIFRDSFGSSIAPLLLSGYSKITLVDLRYISSRILGDYIDFSKDMDVLFLYNTQILNNSYMLK